MSADINDPGHGDTIAAWTTVIAIMVAFAVATLGAWFASSALIIAGGVLIVAGLAAGYVLKRAGYGKDSKN
jgi:uncharacterized membrane protein